MTAVKIACDDREKRWKLTGHHVLSDILKKYQVRYLYSCVLTAPQLDRYLKVQKSTQAHIMTVLSTKRTDLVRSSETVKERRFLLLGHTPPHREGKHRLQ